MTVKELIDELKKCDPDVTVCVDNEEVYICEQLPAYWDGYLQQLIHDPELAGKYHYSIIGVKITENGQKVRLKSIGPIDTIYDNPKIPIEIDISDSASKEHWQNLINEHRKISEDLENELSGA